MGLSLGYYAALLILFQLETHELMHYLHLLTDMFSYLLRQRCHTEY